MMFIDPIFSYELNRKQMLYAFPVITILIYNSTKTRIFNELW